jgi:hypothetical protein
MAVMIERYGFVLQTGVYRKFLAWRFLQKLQSFL